MATAIEAYFVDEGRYPAWNVGNYGPGGAHTYKYGVALSQGISDEPAFLPNFLMNGKAPGRRFSTLTTRYNLGLDFGWVAVFYSDSRSNDTAVSGAAGEFLNDTRDTRTRIVFRWRGRDIRAT